MTRPPDDLIQAKALLESGVSQAETARRLGIPRSTVVTWIRNDFQMRRPVCPPCNPCPYIATMSDNPAYAYLLGLYLGDGCISTHPRGVYRLRIALDLRYPNIIRECRMAMVLVHGNPVGEVLCTGCVEVYACWKHWPCLFPQHGAGPKHKRLIVLEEWQRDIALKRYPHMFVRGLIHSDGCRVMNTVKKKYSYPRYHFTNYSTDIQGIFTEACQAVGVACRYNNRVTQSIARRQDVKHMDMIVGRKS